MRAVFCARGGYGLLRVAASLPVGPPRAVVGFSDVTVLHAALWRRGQVSIHGPVVTQLPRLMEDDRSALWRMLEEPTPPTFEGLRMLVGGVASGPVVGGNLTVLAHLLGTPVWSGFAGAIVVIEDVNEEPYRLDRALTHLLLAGAFEDAAGVACGDLTDCGTPDEVERVLVDRLGSLGIPVTLGLPVGHGVRNRPFPHGARACLDATSGVLRFDQGAVA